ncbi:hypothetical protein Y032_0502g2616 [Ancylostoma ceylanicum]|uniref:Uncharacterized protein n=1 Tax=Ancylostoma ceylanicum TaxID=53326 RepID=A0A016WTY9_9BILA|nr:hypothetical protein Y032_0502g2616 [Ancylostoma ceylanicum]
MATLGSLSTAVSPQIGRFSLCSSEHCDSLAADHTENDSPRNTCRKDRRPAFHSGAAGPNRSSHLEHALRIPRPSPAVVLQSQNLF